MKRSSISQPRPFHFVQQRAPAALQIFGQIFESEECARQIVDDAEPFAAHPVLATTPIEIVRWEMGVSPTVVCPGMDNLDCEPGPSSRFTLRRGKQWPAEPKLAESANLIVTLLRHLYAHDQRFQTSADPRSTAAACWRAVIRARRGLFCRQPGGQPR